MTIIHSTDMLLHHQAMSMVTQMVSFFPTHPDLFSQLNNYILAYNGSTGGSGYEYSSFYPPMHMGANGTMGDKGVGDQAGNSTGNQSDYEHDNHYGKAKTSIVSSPTYHPYSRN